MAISNLNLFNNNDKKWPVNAGTSIQGGGSGESQGIYTAAPSPLKTEELGKIPKRLSLYDRLNNMGTGEHSPEIAGNDKGLGYKLDLTF